MTCAVGLATAGSAAANDVTFWACHGPSGQPLGTGGLSGGAAYGAGCLGQAADLAGGGMQGSSLSLTVRPGVTLKQIFALRATDGLGSEAAAGKAYTATFGNDPFESSPVDVDGSVTAPIASTDPNAATVRFQTQGQDTSLKLGRVGLTVADTSPPTGALDAIGNNFSGSDLKIPAWANDVGAGLDRAEIWVDGVQFGPSVYYNDACRDLTPGGAVDLPIDNPCLLHGEKDVTVDTTQIPDGPHKFTLKVYDIAGNETNFFTDAVADVVNHPNLGSSTQELKIGSGNSPTPNGSNNNGSGGSGGVAGETATSCNSPRLSMELSQKPLKISHGRPVLQYGKRYRFRGRLTCVVKGKRRSAAIKTPIELLNVIGKKTYRKGGATVRKNGAITMILAYKSSRTLVFRYTNPDGRRSQVKLKIEVIKRKSKKS